MAIHAALIAFDILFHLTLGVTVSRIGNHLADLLHAHVTAVAFVAEAEVVVLAIETNPVADPLAESLLLDPGREIEIGALILLFEVVMMERL